MFVHCYFWAYCQIKVQTLMSWAHLIKLTPYTYSTSEYITGLYRLPRECVCMCVCMYVCRYVCMCVYVCVDVDVCVYVCMYVCRYVCMCV